VDNRFLLIVSRGNEPLASYLEQHFKGDSTVQVMVDRRHGDRRQNRPPSPTPESPATAEAGPPERRRNDRRGHPEVDNELRLTSFAIVPLPPEPESPPAIEFV
jgi:hypothetical protein